MFYSIRSERLLMEEMDYNILFRWFVGLNLDEEVWDATTFTKNRERLLEADVAKRFLAAVVEMARTKGRTEASRTRFLSVESLSRDRVWMKSKIFQQPAKPSHPFPNGSSSDGLCGVNSSAPSSVMCISSSRRIPNSPRI